MAFLSNKNSFVRLSSPRRRGSSVFSWFLTYTGVTTLILSALLSGCALFSRPTAPLAQPKKVLYQPQKSFPQTPADAIGVLLNNMHSMQATFEQTTGNQRKVIGRIMLQRPGKFRWETTKPNKQLIIVNNNKSFLYDYDLEEASTRTIDPNQQGNPAMLLSGSAQSLKKSFNVINLGKNRFELTPKNKDAAYQKIQMEFKGGAPKTMQIIDNLDQRTYIIFKNIKLNPKIPPRMFRFNQEQ